MAIFRVEKNTNYTTMCNYHLRDRNLSLKAKGLLSLFLSLPDEWHYSVRGIASICKEGVDSVNGGLRELEDYGYLVRMQTRKENGRMGEIEYVIREMPARQDSWDSPRQGGSRRGGKDTHGVYEDFHGGSGGVIGAMGDPCPAGPSGRRDKGKGMGQQIADIPQPEKYGAHNLQDGSPEPEIPDPYYQEVGDSQTAYQDLENPQDGQSNSAGQWSGGSNAGTLYSEQSNEGSRQPGPSDSGEAKTGNLYEGNLNQWTSQAGRLDLAVQGSDIPWAERPNPWNPNPGSPRSEEPYPGKPQPIEPCTGNPQSEDSHTGNPQPEDSHTGNPQPAKPCTENPYTATPNTEDPARINKDKRNKELNNKRERGRHAPERHRYGRYGNVFLSEKEVEELMTEFPWDYQQRIERLSEYMESTGRFYKNHLATIRSWAGQDRKKDRQKPYGPEIYQYSPEESL